MNKIELVELKRDFSLETFKSRKNQCSEDQPIVKFQRPVQVAKSVYQSCL